MPSNKKPSREEALAWSRSRTVVPSVLAWGAPPSAENLQAAQGRRSYAVETDPETGISVVCGGATFEAANSAARAHLKETIARKRAREASQMGCYESRKANANAEATVQMLGARTPEEGLVMALWLSDPEVREFLHLRGEGSMAKVARIAWNRREPKGTRERAEKRAACMLEGSEP